MNVTHVDVQLYGWTKQEGGAQTGTAWYIFHSDHDPIYSAVNGGIGVPIGALVSVATKPLGIDSWDGTTLLCHSVGVWKGKTNVVVRFSLAATASKVTVMDLAGTEIAVFDGPAPGKFIVR